MTVGELRKWLKGLDDGMAVIVDDGNTEWDAIFTTGHDADLNTCVVIDLTADCERE